MKIHFIIFKKKTTLLKKSNTNRIQSPCNAIPPRRPHAFAWECHLKKEAGHKYRATVRGVSRPLISLFDLHKGCEIIGGKVGVSFVWTLAFFTVPSGLLFGGNSQEIYFINQEQRRGYQKSVRWALVDSSTGALRRWKEYKSC